MLDFHATIFYFRVSGLLSSFGFSYIDHIPTFHTHITMLYAHRTIYCFSVFRGPFFGDQFFGDQFSGNQFFGDHFSGDHFSGTIFSGTIFPGFNFSDESDEIFPGTIFPGTIFTGNIFPRTISPRDHFSGTIFLRTFFLGIFFRVPCILYMLSRDKIFKMSPLPEKLMWSKNKCKLLILYQIHTKIIMIFFGFWFGFLLKNAPSLRFTWFRLVEWMGLWNWKKFL